MLKFTKSLSQIKLPPKFETNRFKESRLAYAPQLAAAKKVKYDLAKQQKSKTGEEIVERAIMAEGKNNTFKNAHKFNVKHHHAPAVAMKQKIKKFGYRVFIL